MLYVVDQALPKTDFLTQVDAVGWLVGRSVVQVIRVRCACFPGIDMVVMAGCMCVCVAEGGMFAFSSALWSGAFPAGIA